jgi:para-aminobenzoate synthetase component I
MDIFTHTGTITGLYQEDIQIDEPFIDFASRFGHIPGSVCLMSGGDLDCSRYHMLATRPFLILSGKGQAMNIQINEATHRMTADPFDTLRLMLNHFRNPDVTFPEPVSAGLFGYLAYDLKDHIETLPRTSVDDLDLPTLYMSAPSLIVVQDIQDKRTRLFIPERSHAGRLGVDDVLAFFHETCKSQQGGGSGFAGGQDVRSNFDKPSYMACIRKIRDYISAGDIYQVNMSQRFEADFEGSPISLFKDLYRKNPAPFFAYVNGGDHWVVSTSPERFIERCGSRGETRPIKGTRPRGKTPEQDQAFKDELTQSRKDDAELSMIVDLMRNDIGKVCAGGSVRVLEHKRVEAYANVYHLISVVEGRLDPGSDSVDLIKATFPGGSITGCPKIRSMEIIDELETNRRHVYTGSIGYLSFHDTLDLSIAIRTATIHNGRLVFSVGGGVVFDSDPADEFEETLHKGKTLMDAIVGSSAPETHAPIVWINGCLKPQAQATLPVSDLGVQYGHGFFETLRVDEGAVACLDEHIDRLKTAWTQFFPQPFPDLSWDLIIGQVIEGCGLGEQTAAVKIMATRGSRVKAPWDYRMIVSARPYTHRLDILGKDGLDIITWDQSRLSPMADYKSMNYQYYYLAGQEAAQKGGDECLILNPDGTVSECNTSNILFVKGRKLVVPSSPHVLRGVMEEKVRERMVSWGYTPEERPVSLSEVSNFDQVFVSNSLMGAVPVLSLDGETLGDAVPICKAINKELIYRGCSNDVPV